MKSFLILLAIGLFAADTAQSQTRPPAGAATGPASATATTRYSVRPPATSAAPAEASPNRRQELYDQYHGVSKRPAAPVPTPAEPVERPATGRPAPEPAASRPDAVAGQPVSSDASASGVRMGIRGGVTYPVYTENLIGIDPTVGFVGGFVFNFGQGMFSFQPELNYARYAVKSREPFGGSAINIATDRFEVPLFLKIASGSANSTRFFLNIGPYGAYASSASLNGQKISLDGSTGRFSFGAAAGVGAALKAGPGHVTVELRGLYELGNPERTISTASRAINAQATVGYMLPLGGNR